MECATEQSRSWREGHAVLTHFATKLRQLQESCHAPSPRASGCGTLRLSGALTRPVSVFVTPVKFGASFDFFHRHMELTLHLFSLTCNFLAFCRRLTLQPSPARKLPKLRQHLAHEKAPRQKKLLLQKSNSGSSSDASVKMSSSTKCASKLQTRSG